MEQISKIGSLNCSIDDKTDYGARISNIFAFQNASKALPSYTIDTSTTSMNITMRVINTLRQKN